MGSVERGPPGNFEGHQVAESVVFPPSSPGRAGEPRPGLVVDGRRLLLVVVDGVVEGRRRPGPPRGKGQPLRMPLGVDGCVGYHGAWWWLAGPFVVGVATAVEVPSLASHGFMGGMSSRYPVAAFDSYFLAFSEPPLLRRPPVVWVARFLVGDDPLKAGVEPWPFSGGLPGPLSALGKYHRQVCSWRWEWRRRRSRLLSIPLLSLFLLYEVLVLAVWWSPGVEGRR